jgi:predicted nucleic acid-binding protein
MCVADTSFLIVLFDEDDHRHAQARKDLATGPVLVCTEILVETLGVLKVKAGRAVADAALDGLWGTENIRWEETCDLLRALGIYRSHPRLSLPDAIAIELALRHDAELLTADGRQAAVWRKLR